jgi:hypothetical protein
MGYAETNHSDEAMPNFSPAHLTTLSLAPPEMIRVQCRGAAADPGHTGQSRLPADDRSGDAAENAAGHRATGIPVAREVSMTALTLAPGLEVVARRVIQAARRLLNA